MLVCNLVSLNQVCEINLIKNDADVVFSVHSKSK